MTARLSNTTFLPPPLTQLVHRALVEPLTLVLGIVAAVTIGALRQIAEGAAIAAIVVLNVGIGVTQERRARSAVDALEDLTAPTVRVRRSGRGGDLRR